MTKTRETPRSHDDITTASSPAETTLVHSGSPLVDNPYDAEFEIEWDNDFKFHFSRNLLYLRRYRGQSQATLATAVGARQPQIARIEGGDENITLETAERMTKALKGRLIVSIAPEEFPVVRPMPWWEAVEHKSVQGGTWFVAGVTSWQTPRLDHILAKLERPRTVTISSVDQLLIAQTAEIN